MIFSAKRNAEYHQKTFRSFNDTPHDFNDRILETIVDMYLEILTEYC